MASALSHDRFSPNPIKLLYLDHAAWLRNLLHRRLGSAGDAADLAQEVFVQVLRTGRVPSAADSRPHLARIANCLAIDLYRRRQLEAAYVEALASQGERLAPSAETRALALEALIEIDRVLQGLPVRVREALLLCRLDGLRYAEIAERLGVTVSSVQKYIATGLAAFYHVMYEAEPLQLSPAARSYG